MTGDDDDDDDDDDDGGGGGGGGDYDDEWMRRLKLNLLKPTGHVMHHQFNIQQLYALATLYLCVLYLSENNQRFVPLTA